jgi:hypothetical protein
MFFNSTVSQPPVLLKPAEILFTVPTQAPSTISVLSSSFTEPVRSSSTCYHSDSVQLALINMEDGTLDTPDTKIALEVKPQPDSKLRQVHVITRHF